MWRKGCIAAEDAFAWDSNSTAAELISIAGTDDIDLTGFLFFAVVVVFANVFVELANERWLLLCLGLGSGVVVLLAAACSVTD